MYLEPYQPPTDTSSHWSCNDVLGYYETSCNLTLSIEEARDLRDSLKNRAIWTTVGFGTLFAAVAVLGPISWVTAGVIAGSGIYIGIKSAEPYSDLSNEIHYALENVQEGEKTISISIESPNSRLSPFEINAAGSEPVYIPRDTIDSVFGGFD